VVVKPLVRVAALSGYVDVSRELGADPRELLKRVGLDIGYLTTQDRWIPGTAVARLLELSAAAGCEEFGVRMAERRRFANLGPISLVLREEPDVRRALTLLIRYQHTFNEVLHMRLAEENGLATVRVSLDFGEPVADRQSIELSVGTLHQVLINLLPGRWQPVAVYFTHRAPAGTAAHCRLFGPVVEFDREFNGIVFFAADLDTPNIMADPVLRDYARQFFKTVAVEADRTVPDRVSDLIEALLPTGRCSAEQVARSLGVDRRTVHRRLADSGLTFSAMLRAKRVQLAELLLANPRSSMTEISSRLGFTETSSFSRWFRVEFGCSPREWRSRETG
jgi:AraC-like DNA-binding protein